MTATLVFHSGPDPFEPWRDALSPHLGRDVLIEESGSVTDPEAVR